MRARVVPCSCCGREVETLPWQARQRKWSKPTTRHWCTRCNVLCCPRRLKDGLPLKHPLVTSTE